ncbi:anti-sigma factor domain-containing protein [Tumebacillus sp. ITR2]|uniref:Anti-sigma factor domain-containing protein n=1 Tax=Tumebacillus amylolyticus TaxID=2801339 RepID=A0ABS1JBB7_9BACL|nr:anti-sigma factor domain-containing protein [Tumebacillus amylolyticus]MBL0387485.1 anti-sigma factor domain-containing protein [Tumebacillus amylolyticus]
MQNKGIVMQIANEQAIVMTKDCQFRKIPFLDGMAVGLEVELPGELRSVPSTNKTKKSWYAKPWRKTSLVAASVLLAVGLWGSQSFLGETPAYAYVTVDINPSVELSIDKNQEVLAAVALNEEAEDVVRDLKLKGLSVNQAVESLAQAAQSKGFFQDKTEVIITASAAVDEEKLKQENVDLVKLEDDLVSKVKTLAVQQNPGVEVEGLLVSKEVREAAKQEGVSPGKYALYLNATSNGIDVSLDDLKKQPIHKVVDQQPQMAEVVHQMQGGQELDSLLKTLKEEGKPKLLNQGKAKGILPSGETKQSDEGQKIPPGQAKKDDNTSNKQDDSKKVEPPSQSKSNDREQNSKSNNGNNGKGSSKKDDDGHSTGKDNGKNDKSKAQQQSNSSSKNNDKNDKQSGYKKDDSRSNSNKNDHNDKKSDPKYQSQSRGYYDLHIKMPSLH